MASRKCSCSVSSEQRKTNDVPGGRVTWELSKMAGQDRGGWGRAAGRLRGMEVRAALEGPRPHPRGGTLRGTPSLMPDTITTNYVIWTNPRLKLEAQRSRDSFSLFIFFKPHLATAHAPCLPLSRRPPLPRSLDVASTLLQVPACKEPKRMEILAFDFPTNQRGFSCIRACAYTPDTHK